MKKIFLYKILFVYFLFIQLAIAKEDSEIIENLKSIIENYRIGLLISNNQDNLIKKLAERLKSDESKTTKINTVNYLLVENQEKIDSEFNKLISIIKEKDRLEKLPSLIEQAQNDLGVIYGNFRIFDFLVFENFIDILSSKFESSENDLNKLVEKINEANNLLKTDLWKEYLSKLDYLSNKIPIFKQQWISDFFKLAKNETNGNLLENKKVVITFDDGPSPKTTRNILNILQNNTCGKKPIPATFFIVGQNLELETNQQILIEEIDSGMTIGNHSWNHANLPKLDKDKIFEQIFNAL
jgi:hypothetical protein